MRGEGTYRQMDKQTDRHTLQLTERIGPEANSLIKFFNKYYFKYRNMKVPEVGGLRDYTSQVSWTMSNEFFFLPWFRRFSEHIQSEDLDKERDLEEKF